MMEVKDESSYADFIKSIRMYPFEDQNRLLMERLEYIEKLNQKDMDEINECIAAQGGGIVETRSTVDVTAKQQQLEQSFDRLRLKCRTKQHGAEELAQFCIDHFTSQEKEKVKLLNAMLRRTERMQEAAKSRLQALNNGYAVKVKTYEGITRKMRTQNYLFYQLISDEMYRRIGTDADGSTTYADHLEAKKNLERNIIRHNQHLMSTEEGKTSTSSSVTAYTVEALKKDVDRLEQVVDDHYLKMKKEDDNSYFFATFDDSVESDDELCGFLKHESTEDRMSHIKALTKFEKLKNETFSRKKNEIFQSSNAITNLRQSSPFLDGNRHQNGSRIVNGDEVSFSDFSI